MTATIALRTAEECLAKAADMDRMAKEYDRPAWRAELAFMARCWRAIAAKVGREEACRLADGESPS